MWRDIRRILHPQGDTDHIKFWRHPAVLSTLPVSLTTPSYKTRGSHSCREERDMCECMCVTVTESKFIPSCLRKPPAAPSTLLNYQSRIVLQTSAVMLSGFFLWSGPSHKTTVTWVIDPAMKMAILLCINMKAACGTGALSDSSLFLLRGKIHTQLMAVQREALLWDIK